MRPELFPSLVPPKKLCSAGIMYSRMPYGHPAIHRLSVNTLSLSRVMQSLYLVQGFQWLGEYSIFITWVGNAEYILKVKCQRSRSSRDQTECYNGGSMHLDGATSRLTCFTCAVTYTSHFSVQSAKTGYSHFCKNPTHSKILKQNSKFTG